MSDKINNLSSGGQKDNGKQNGDYEYARNVKASEQTVIQSRTTSANKSIERSFRFA